MSAPATPAVDEAAIEAAAARAWPAQQRQAVGPWLARWNGGYSRRANSVALLGPAANNGEAEFIGEAEAFYRQRNASCRFQVALTARNAGVIAALEARGYGAEPGSHTHVQTAATRSLRLLAPPTRDGRVLIAEGPSGPWLDRWWEEVAEGRGDDARDTLSELLWDIPGRCAFASHVVDGRVVATGLGVADGPYLGLFCATTDPALRQRGSARRVVGGIATWGLAQATRTAYLQVSASNEAALRFTAAAGFVTAYDYCYYLAPS